MPYISFEGPFMSLEQKKAIIKEFTEIASVTLQIPKEAITVAIKENNPENVGVGGISLAERFKK
ncbi:MAG: 4-oxalocrotonate tautomerase DmpI [Bacillota bacterium]|nr:4-oxalocrotonate tautomerase DmpI [Bacillota bacterium]